MAMEQLPLRVRLRDSARFEGFVPGANAEVCSLLQAHASAPPVIWLWGRAGCGKTHLLQATCAAAGERGEPAAYIDLSTAPGPEMLEGCETLATVCLDAMDEVAADAAWNAALFRLHTLL